VFENDAACDWLKEVARTADLRFIEATLAQVDREGAGYIDADAAGEALAACELISRLVGAGSEEAAVASTEAWLASAPGMPDADLRARAAAVVARVAGPDSELGELWEEVGEADDWRAILRGLEARLRG
jgi:hypothetical protein